MRRRRRQADSAALDLREEGLAETVALAAAGDRLSTHAVDISDRKAVEKVPAAIQKAHGAIDGLVNVAGIIRRAVHWEMTDEDWTIRYVNPAVSPEFLSVNFSRETPSHYLLRTAPLAEAEHVVESRLADGLTRRLLKIAADEPCLIVRRRTWSRGLVASYAVLTHPGSRYRLVGRFKP